MQKRRKFFEHDFPHLRPNLMPLPRSYQFDPISCEDAKVVCITGRRGHLLLQSAELLHFRHCMHGTGRTAVDYLCASSVVVCATVGCIAESVSGHTHLGVLCERVGSPRSSHTVKVTELCVNNSYYINTARSFTSGKVPFSHICEIH